MTSVLVVCYVLALDQPITAFPLPFTSGNFYAQLLCPHSMAGSFTNRGVHFCTETSGTETANLQHQLNRNISRHRIAAPSPLAGVIKQSRWSGSRRLLQLQDAANTESQENTHRAEQQVSREPKGSPNRSQQLIAVIQRDVKDQTVRQSVRQ